jgi:hypothetical protein
MRTTVPNNEDEKKKRKRWGDRHPLGVEMEKYHFILNGAECFRCAYTVYIIEIKHNQNGSFYYIGQTGDKKYKSARAPFYRLAGHLNEQNKSTENQVYKGIVYKILKMDWSNENKEFIKNKVNEYLIQTTIKMSIYQYKDFNSNITIENHQKNVKEINEVENELILKLIELFGQDKILNKKYNNAKTKNDAISQFVEEIKKQINS